VYRIVGDGKASNIPKENDVDDDDDDNDNMRSVKYKVCHYKNRYDYDNRAEEKK